MARLPLLQKPQDYAAFERVLPEAGQRCPIRLLVYCLMPNHWHMVLWPRAEGELTAFVRWLTHSHTMRWHAHHHSAGTGHLYQGRFKSFPVQSGEHFLTVCRYVERNALRADLVERAEDWRWSSLRRRHCGVPEARESLSDWPAGIPRNWLHTVDLPQSQGESSAAQRLAKARTAVSARPQVVIRGT